MPIIQPNLTILRIKFHRLLLLSPIFLLSGCDSVAPDNRLIEIPAATVRRNVLVEEFTGQKCINCPTAATAIEQLEHTYTADHLIAVGIHGGNLAFYGTAKLRGLRTPLADDYYK